MKTTSDCKSKGLRLALLAPEARIVPSLEFTQSTVHPFRYDALLSSVQRLRGRVYAEDGAISIADLDCSGRHLMENDRQSWHLALVDDQNAVDACIRIFVDRHPVTFDRLLIRHSALSQSREWGQRVRSAVGREIREAQDCKFTYVELGGWALATSARGTTAALACLAATYAWAQLTGGCIGICTATVRHSSASILCRTGGSPLEFEGVRLPAYYDPAYRCHMELLRFDSRMVTAKFRPLVSQMRQHLLSVPVITTTQYAHVDRPIPESTSDQSFTNDILSLSSATRRLGAPSEETSSQKTINDAPATAIGKRTEPSTGS